MVQKRFFGVILCGVVLFNFSSIFSTKYIIKGAPALNCMHAATYFVKQSNFLSDDLKKAFSEHPSKLQDLSEAVSGLMFFALIRPSTEQAELAEKKLLNSTATPQDLATAFKVVAAYGEAAYAKGTFSKLYYEPTDGPRFPMIISHFEQPFKSALDTINGSISSLGTDLKWPKEKIESEQKLLIDKLGQFFEDAIQKPTATEK